MGYSLDRSSVPLCEGVSKEKEQNCFLKQRKKFIWENRDFIVESDAILQYIENFVLFGREKERSCEEMIGQLNERFVLYNIWCTKPPYWYPGLTEHGERSCIHGSNYPLDHTDETKKEIMLFENKEDCCSAFRLECQDSKGTAQPSSSELALFHKYHEVSSAKEAASSNVKRIPNQERKKRTRNKD